MKLSLREARKLDQRIQAKINKGIIHGRALNIHESVLNDQNMLDGWLAEAFAMGDDSIKSIVNLIASRSTIRRAVQSTNEENGINELISQRQLLLNVRGVWTDVVNSYDVGNGHAMTSDVLSGAARSAIEASKTSSRTSMYGGSRNDIITVATVSDDTYEQAESRVRDLIRQIDDIEDKLTSLNATSKIELESTLVDLLQEEELF